jgi:hypothetical protein
VVDARHDLKILSHFKYALAHEERAVVESIPLFDQRIEYQTLDGGLFVRKTFNRLSLQFGGAVRHVDFEDTSIFGLAVGQDFRDETIHELNGKVGYEASPRTALFADVTHKRREYRDPAFNTQGYGVLGGISCEFTRLIRGEAAAGYMSQEFESPLRKEVSTFTYRGQLHWEPTPLVGLVFFGNREVAVPSNFAGTTTFINSQAGVRVDYAISGHLTLSGVAAYNWVDFVDFDGRIARLFYRRMPSTL